MKTVFNNDQVAHVWTTRTQQEGRSNNGQVFFDHRTIYSYGRHFPMAVLMGEEKSVGNADSYSLTTSRHQSLVCHATRGHLQVSIPKLGDIARTLEDIADSINAGNGNGKPSPSQVQSVLSYIERHASALGEAVAQYDPNYVSPENRERVEAGETWMRGQWVPTGRNKAQVLASLCGIDDRRALAALKRGAAKDAKKARETAAYVRKRDKAHAVRLADMEPAERTAYVRDHWHVRDWQTLSHGGTDSYGLERRKEASKGLFRILKLARAEGLSARRIQALKAARESILSEVRTYEADSAKAVAEQRAIQFSAWEVRHDAATTDAERFALWEAMGSYGRTQVRNYAEGTPERAKLEGFVIWGRGVRDARVAVQQAEAREAWLKGEGPRSVRLDGPNGTALVRRSPDGERLETSHGADVPWSHAVKAFRFIQACKDTGEAFHTNGRVVRVGHFTVSSISAEGDMIAGCHRFAYSVMRELALAQGVDMTGSTEAVEVKA